MLMYLFVNSVYAEEGFVYNDHGKRDPFTPLVSSSGMVLTYDEDLSLNDLVLEGIVADASGNNAAIVNGKVVRVHDEVGPYVVQTIGTDHVDLMKGSEAFTLKLKKQDAAYER